MRPLVVFSVREDAVRARGFLRRHDIRAEVEPGIEGWALIVSERSFSKAAEALAAVLAAGHRPLPAPPPPWWRRMLE